MDLREGDCLELMKELPDNSVDLLFADLPFGQTSCVWDVLIDLELFWKEVNRVCKPDSPKIFTTTTKFGNVLINSNPKNFRHDLVWIKSSPVGFLNSTRVSPMRKHELVYVFYNKLSPVYSINIARYHKHKFKDAEPKKKIVSQETNDVYGGVYTDCDHASSKNYVGYGDNNNFTIYEPPLPNSVIKEEKTQISKKQIAGENNLYGDTAGGTIGNVHGTNYEPPLPNSIIKEDNCKYDVNKNAYGGGKPGRIKISKAKREHEVRYEPPLPNSILEINSERGKHATQKPVALMEWILKYYSTEGGVVLDPTMGSGSMGEACKNMERFFIGFEKDKDIFDVAFNRLIDV